MADPRFNTGDPIMDAALAADDAKLDAMGACEDEDEYDGDGWCVECGEEFHLDDVGGYNPPCSCGFHCRHCHDAVEGRFDPDDDYPEDDDE